jgi:predicted DNA-binding ribbon-helix-helix protein
MKTVKVDDVHYSMLKDIGKKWRMSPEDLIAELIQETYSSKTKRS